MSQEFYEKAQRWRIIISRFCAYDALLALILAIMIIAALLIQHWLSGDWPFRYWDMWDMNHGPWGYDFGFNPRGERLSTALLLIIDAANISFLALILKPKKFTAFVFAVCFVCFWLSMYYLYWLID